MTSIIELPMSATQHMYKLGYIAAKLDMQGLCVSDVKGCIQVFFDNNSQRSKWEKFAKQHGILG